jgi:hypothetical protein
MTLILFRILALARPSSGPVFARDGSCLPSSGVSPAWPRRRRSTALTPCGVQLLPQSAIGLMGALWGLVPPGKICPGLRNQVAILATFRTPIRRTWCRKLGSRVRQINKAPATPGQRLKPGALPLQTRLRHWANPSVQQQDSLSLKVILVLAFAQENGNSCVNSEALRYADDSLSRQ